MNKSVGFFYRHNLDLLKMRSFGHIPNDKWIAVDQSISLMLVIVWRKFFFSFENNNNIVLSLEQRENNNNIGSSSQSLLKIRNKGGFCFDFIFTSSRANYL